MPSKNAIKQSINKLATTKFKVVPSVQKTFKEGKLIVANINKFMTLFL